MAKDMIIYYLDRGEGKEAGPFVCQILSSYVRGVTVSDAQVIEYVQKMHKVNPTRIERINLKEEEDD